MDGRYIYCVADSGEEGALGKIGIEENEVYTISFKDLCAVVHACPARPYESKNDVTVKYWVIVHQCVVDAAWERFDTILPISFDTIIKGKGNIGAEENTRNWLKQDYENLRKRLEKVRDRAEYGVQVFWDTSFVVKKLIDTSSEIKRLKKEIASKPAGTAYMYRQRLEKVLRREMEIKACLYFKDFYSRIKRHVDDSYIEKTKETNGENQMLMNLSCLVIRDKDEYMKLGEELEKIDCMNGFSVRFTGPWPPYSFVAY